LESEISCLALLKEELIVLEDVWKQKIVFQEATKMLLKKQDKEIIFFVEMINRKKEDIKKLEEQIKKDG